MLSLGIDTSNYATSLAVYSSDKNEMACALKQFLPVKQGELGLRQSDALFHHTVALPKMYAQLSENVDLTQLSCVGVSAKPRNVEGSYMPCFLAGASFAAAVSKSLNIPLIETTHQQGHIAATLFACKDKSLYSEKVLVFHISGGTTDLLLCNGYNTEKMLATSLDLYAGQAVDRLGAMLGFSFPSGAYISAAAESCAESFNPRITLKDNNCCLSGLENQCSKFIKEGKGEAYVSKYCLSYIAHTIIKMIDNAKMLYPSLPIICAGGVMSSGIIKEIVQSAYPNAHFVPGEFSSDNAMGTAFIASREVMHGKCN